MTCGREAFPPYFTCSTKRGGEKTEDRCRQEGASSCTEHVQIVLQGSPDHVMLMLRRFSRDQLASKARGDRCVPIVLKLSDGIRAARAY